MRTIATGVVVALTLLVGGGAASAIEYPWCAEYGGSRGGGTNCGFATLEQCRWAISGNGGFCRENLFYRGSAYEPDVVVRPRYKKRPRHRHNP